MPAIFNQKLILSLHKLITTQILSFFEIEKTINENANVENLFKDLKEPI
jgi:hypothetical protein